MGYSRDPQLRLIIQALTRGDSRQHAIIRQKLEAYVRTRLAGSAADIEDTVAEITATLLEALTSDRFRGRTLPEFNGFLYGIARMKILQAVSQRERHALGRNTDAQSDVADSRANGPDRIVANNDLARHVYAAVNSKCRQLLQLKYEECWTDQEIADLYGMTKNAISTAICRCLKTARAAKAVQENMYQKPRENDLGDGR